MTVKFIANIPDDQALFLTKEIIKFAKLNLDVDLTITSYGSENELNICSLQNAIFGAIVKDQEKELSNE